MSFSLSVGLKSQEQYVVDMLCVYWMMKPDCRWSHGITSVDDLEIVIYLEAVEYELFIQWSVHALWFSNPVLLSQLKSMRSVSQWRRNLSPMTQPWDSTHLLVERVLSFLW